MSIEWDGTDEQMIAALERYEADVQKTVRAVADYFAPIIEREARVNAVWTDRTGNARAGLHSEVEDLAQQTVALWLSHGVNYGLWLEVIGAGKWAIIAPTLEAHYGQIEEMLRGIFA